MKRRAILLMAAIGAVVLLASGVALAENITCNFTPPCHGTPESDSMTGTSYAETIYAYEGGDTVYSGGGDDTIYGSSGNDDLVSEGNSDRVYGGGGNDTFHPSDSDTAGSTDYVYGGGGKDIIYASDTTQDIINCGKGTDTVYYDSLDTIKGCENKNPV